MLLNYITDFTENNLQKLEMLTSRALIQVWSYFGKDYHVHCTIDGNREMGQLYKTSQVLNISKKQIFSH